MVGLNVRFRVRFFTLKNQSEKKIIQQKTSLTQKYIEKVNTVVRYTVAQKKNTYFKTFKVCPHIFNTLLNVK